jgi:hypothetical protein
MQNHRQFLHLIASCLPDDRSASKTKCTLDRNKKILIGKQERCAWSLLRQT